MQTHEDLIRRYGKNSLGTDGDGQRVHAVITATSGRIEFLRETIGSLLGQVDTLHVFLEGIDILPDFLSHDKIFITGSREFGNLGECGKYYWTGDLEGFIFACSDSVVYPADYTSVVRDKLESIGRNAVVGFSGYRITGMAGTFAGSLEGPIGGPAVSDGTVADILSDSSLAFHTSRFQISRHQLYQPGLSFLWLSMEAARQGIPRICLGSPQGWLKCSEDIFNRELHDPDGYKNFAVRSGCFRPSPVTSDFSSSINGLFDRIFVMNLDRRPDRMERVKRLSKNYGIEVTRFPAVDGYTEPFRSDWDEYSRKPLQQLPAGIEPLADYKDKFRRYEHHIARIHFMESKLNRKAIQSPGAWGYACSYIAILEEAIRKGYSRIMILDDDILLHRSFNSLFSEFYRELPDNWMMFMAGGMQHYWDPWITWRSGHLYCCNGSSVASHAVAITAETFLPLLWQARRMDLPIDEGAVFHIQNIYRDRSFVFYPNLVIQDLGESDISTSAMKSTDTARWLELFRWKPGDYDPGE